MLSFVQFATAVGLALVPVFAGALQRVSRTHRNRWLSFGGGISVAYVFVHILPELRYGQTLIDRAADPLTAFVDHHVYVLALIGLIAFYGLEHVARRAAPGERGGRAPDRGGPGTEEEDDVFWVHIGAFAVYNGIIGYLLVHRLEPEPTALFFFAAAIAPHFVVNDDALRDHHERIYDRVGRWILAGAVIVGWAIGTVTRPALIWIEVLFAVLAGALILNVLKEELPEERKSRFWAFAIGALGYGAVLMFL